MPSISGSSSLKVNFRAKQEGGQGSGSQGKSYGGGTKPDVATGATTQPHPHCAAPGEATAALWVGRIEGSATEDALAGIFSKCVKGGCVRVRGHVCVRGAIQRCGVLGGCLSI